MSAIDDLRRSIQAQLEQIEDEAAALRRALAELGGPLAPARAPAPGTRARTAEPTARAAEPTPGTAEPTPRTAEAPSGAAEPRVRAAAPPTRAGGPAMQVVPAERLASMLAGSEGGLSTAELAELTGGHRDQILTLLRELEQAGEVRRRGERRGTRWHAVTDEDRIAQRVAELESRAARPPTEPASGPEAEAEGAEA